MAFTPSTPVGSGKGGSGKPKESATGGVQAGVTPSSSSGGGGGGGSAAQRQADFENQVQAVQVATGSSGKEAATVVRQVEAQGNRVVTTPSVISRLRSERLQSNYENQVQAVQSATGSSSRQAATVVREAQSQGKEIVITRAAPAPSQASRLLDRAAFATPTQQPRGVMPSFGVNQYAALNTQPAQPTKGVATRFLRAKERLQRDFSGPLFENVQVRTDKGQTYTVPARDRALLGIAVAGPLLSIGASGTITSKVTPAKTLAGKVRQSIFSRFSTPERIVATTAQSIGVGVFSVEGGKGVARITAPKSQRDIFSSSEYRGIVRQAARERDVAVQQLPFYKQIAADVIPIYRPAESQFTKSLESQFRNLGYSEDQVKSGVAAVKRERRGATIGEVIGLVNVGRSSETLGRALVGRQFLKSSGKEILKTKAGREVVKRAVPSIALAGLQEGVATEIVQSRSRERDITAKNLAFSGVFGAASAGVIGGGIAGLAPNYPKSSRIIEVLAYTTDPYEYPGDILADVSEGVAARYGRRIAPKPILTPVNVKRGEAPRFAIGTSTEPGFRFSRIVTPVRPTTQTQTRTSTNPRTSVPTQSFIGGLQEIFPRLQNPPTNPRVTPPVRPPVNPTISTRPSVPTNIFLDVEPTVPPDTPTEIPIPLEIPSFSNIAIPVNAPLFGLPPPVPLGFPGGASRALGNESRRFINELDLALGVVPRGRGTTRPGKTQRPNTGLFGTGSLFTKLYVGPTRRGRRQ